jgi:hypothetical protein
MYDEDVYELEVFQQLHEMTAPSGVHVHVNVFSACIFSSLPVPYFFHLLKTSLFITMSNLNVRVHPVVLFNIVDAYERRQFDQHRVIGTLLGTTDKSGVVEITNSFVVQHRETDQEVAIDIEVAKELFELYRKVNGNESIVGWFATGEGDVNEYSVRVVSYA